MCSRRGYLDEGREAKRRGGRRERKRLLGPAGTIRSAGTDGRNRMAFVSSDVAESLCCPCPLFLSCPYHTEHSAVLLTACLALAGLAKVTSAVNRRVEILSYPTTKSNHTHLRPETRLGAGTETKIFFETQLPREAK